MLPKEIYYSDLLNDEFSFDDITPKRIDGSYKYFSKSLVKKITHIFWYRIVAYPIAKIYMFLKFRHKIIGRKVLKKYKKKGYFMYGNHTANLADAVVPTMINKTKDVYLIVHPNNVSIKYIGRVTPSMGAIPLPDTKEATENFIKCLDYRINKNKCITIYPEAHIWPYYTKIRPFKDLSFRYPINYNVPTFCFTNVYKKRRGNKVKMVTYVDGPFFPNVNLSKKDKRLDLRNQVYNKMVERSMLNEVEVIKYIKKEVIND